MARKTEHPTRLKVLSPAQIEELKEGLIEERRLQLELASADLETGRQTGQNGTDVGDISLRSYTREFLGSLSEVSRIRLVEIEEALRRIQKGTYGICLHTGEPIALERLQAVPWARYTVEAQEKIELGEIEGAW